MFYSDGLHRLCCIHVFCHAQLKRMPSAECSASRR
uniref:Uncharacterized protein n=1 Tax=Setaria italica TaxID=4555 RepID=K3ZG48_SETIT